MWTVDWSGEPLRRLSGQTVTFSDEAVAQRYCDSLPGNGYSVSEVTDPMRIVFTERAAPNLRRAAWQLSGKPAIVVGFDLDKPVTAYWLWLAEEIVAGRSSI